jgi:quercetin dioxygenase-like cupin family protein
MELFTELQSAPSYVPNSDHVGFSESKILLDTPPSTNYKITYSVIEPGGYAEEHFHPWDHAYFIVKGKARIGIGSEVREIGEGSLAYVPPNKKHFVQNLLNVPLVILAVVGPNSMYAISKEEEKEAQNQQISK